mmetsp:Transcript_47523/g.106720  ORF Transcript_47523/g.106720 Transcript_47523/m.106720 type:complete len:396 (-) Transcript_47523:43-1230(-)
MWLLLLLAVACEGGWIEDEVLRSSTASRVGGAPRRLAVDLGKPPRERWSFLARTPGFDAYKATADRYLEKYVPAHVLPIVDRITQSMEIAYYKEYAEEMQSLAEALNLSVGEVVLINLIYQVEGIGTACYKVNTTGPCPTKGPGLCTGLVANGPQPEDPVWQGRNLDWDLDASLLQFVAEVDYQRNGTTVFTAVQVVGMIGVLHGVYGGKFSVQLNARDRGGDVAENLLEELLLGGKTPTHVMRKALEDAVDYSAAEQFLLTERLANPAYFILAGAEHGQGAILTRMRRHGSAWHLNEAQADDKRGINPQPDWFRLQTNYDPWEAVPSYDNRRGPSVANAAAFCAGSVDEACMEKVMTTWPTKNHHTDITSLMCPRTGYMRTFVWHLPQSETMVV